MTLETVETEISRFLAASENEVLVVQGAWGVGKTYGWNTTLRSSKKDVHACVKNYAYVSLFGIRDLEQLKRTLFENTIKREHMGSNPSIDSYGENTSGLAESLVRKWGRKAATVSLGKKFEPTIDALSFHSIRESLICLDDLERRHSSLGINEVLGLVSLLRDQRRCRIVLLLNSEEGDMEDYAKYREKVVDVEILYDPTPAECSSIAFSKVNCISKHMPKHAETLNIRNIRTLKKADRAAKMLIPHLGNPEEETLHAIAQSLVLFTHCHFSASDIGVPNLEFVVSDSHSKYYGDGEEGPTETEQSWTAILQAYQYSYTSSLDRNLARLVESGYVEPESLTKALLETNQQFIVERSSQSFSAAWRKYHDSLENNRDEVLDSLYESFSNNAAHISAMNLDGTVRLFRELSDDTRAEELLERWVRAQDPNSEAFNVAEYAFSSDIQDLVVRKRLQAAYSAVEGSESLADVVIRLANSRGWKGTDEAVMSAAEVTDYVDLFRMDHGKMLSSVVDACLRMGRSSGASDEQKEITKKAEQALMVIGGESGINRRRVAKFGIQVENQATKLGGAR